MSALQRARSQRLLGNRLSSPVDAVRAVVGVQAQDQAAGALSIRVRTRGLTRADVDRTLVEDRSLVRLWAMRGTIHLVVAEDARWLVELLSGPTLRGSHRRLSQLGVPAGDVPRAVKAITRALASAGPLTRAELMEHVARTGVTTDGQAAAHLCGVTALQGLTVNGPNRSGRPSFVLRDDWLGSDLPSLPRGEALAELARRYERAFRPATAEDFATWSGLPLRDARAGFSSLAPRGARTGPRAPKPPDIRLLPAFDTYLLGYRSREFAVPPEHARAVAPGGGIIRPTVVENGRAVGTWRRAGSNVEIEPFERGSIEAAAEIADVQRFLAGRPARPRSSRA